MVKCAWPEGKGETRGMDSMVGTFDIVGIRCDVTLRPAFLAEGGDWSWGRLCIVPSKAAGFASTIVEVVGVGDVKGL